MVASEVVPSILNGRVALILLLFLSRTKLSMVRAHRVTNWDAYHQQVDELHQHGQLYKLFYAIQDINERWNRAHPVCVAERTDLATSSNSGGTQCEFPEMP